MTSIQTFTKFNVARFEASKEDYIYKAFKPKSADNILSSLSFS